MAGMEIITKNKNIFFSLIIIIFLFLCFFLIKNNISKNFEIGQIQSIKIAGKTLKVDLALTADEQERGLSGRNFLGEDEGMLFVFNQADKYSFWMKDMRFPIDIIWISDDLRVVFLKENVSPETYPEAFTPSQNARYVLEVSAGFSKKENLKPGDRVEFLPS